MDEATVIPNAHAPLNFPIFQSSLPVTQIAAPKLFGVLLATLLYGGYLAQLGTAIRNRSKIPAAEGRRFTGYLVALLTAAQTVGTALMFYTAWLKFVPEFLWDPHGVANPQSILPTATYPVHFTSLFNPNLGPKGLCIVAGIVSALYQVYFARKIWVAASSTLYSRLAMVVCLLALAEIPMGSVEAADRWTDAWDFRTFAFARSAIGLVAQILVVVMAARMFAPPRSAEASRFSFTHDQFDFYAFQIGPLVFLSLIGQMATVFTTDGLDDHEPYLFFMYISIPAYGNSLLAWINSQASNSDNGTSVVVPRMSNATRGSMDKDPEALLYSHGVASLPKGDA